MNSPKERKRILNLEKDLLLTKDNFGAISASQPREPEDLDGYLDFLDELWGSGKKKIEKRVYSEPFQL